MTKHRKSGWVTAKPLIFNDPIKGENFTIPAGEPCALYTTVEEAIERGTLKKDDEDGIWAAKKNTQRGYVLVMLKGKLRGVAQDDIEYH